MAYCILGNCDRVTVDGFDPHPCTLACAAARSTVNVPDESASRADDQFEPGDVVVLKSGGVPMTVSRTWTDDRYESRRRYASLAYFNPVTGSLESKNVATALLTPATA